MKTLIQHDLQEIAQKFYSEEEKIYTENYDESLVDDLENYFNNLETKIEYKILHLDAEDTPGYTSEFVIAIWAEEGKIQTYSVLLEWC